MINLLIISNNPRSKELQSHFQQVLKLKIDLATDFDQGLKEVFEKRPRIVCIQDQIAGVTGESVAKHIQLLLGKSAPVFILQHNGNPNARTITGLFNYMVDMEQPFEQRICKVKNIIKEVAGDEQWEKIYKPVTESENNSSQKPDAQDENNSPDADEEQEFQIESSFDEQLAALTAAADAARQADLSLDPLPENVVQQILETQPPAFDFQEPEVTVEAQATPQKSGSSALPPKQQLEPPDQTAQPPKPTSKEPPQLEAERKTVKATSPIMDEELFDENDISSIDGPQHSAEEKQLKRKQFIRIAALLIVLVLVIVRGAHWYIKRPDLNQHKEKPAAIEQDKQQELDKNAETAKKVRPKQGKLIFIATAQKDNDWQGPEPGWSRYLTDSREYRLFYADQELHAVQVIAIGGTTIQTEELQVILQELSGLDDYQITSSEHRDGAWQERAKVLDKADLLIYRSKTKGPILAFVYAVSK